MRILGYIDHPTYFVTVFRMEDKFSIQFEKGLLVQTYKYRSGPQLSNLKELEAMVNADYLNRVEQVFQQMELTKTKHLPAPIDEDEFDEII